MVPAADVAVRLGLLTEHASVGARSPVSSTQRLSQLRTEERDGTRALVWAVVLAH